MKIRITTLVSALAVGISAIFGSASYAQSYPSKAIRLIVPYGAGGSSDITGRIVGQELSRILGVPVVVENRSGAGGTIGSTAVAKAAPDGYTLLMGTSGALTLSPNLYAKPSYNSATDFSPVSIVATTPSVLLVNKDVPANSISELIDLAKKGELSFASAGTGSTQFLGGELFNSLAHVDILHVPYTGAGPASIDLNGGRVSMMFDTLPSALTNLRLGKVRALGVTTAKAITSLPGIPPIADTLPNFIIDAWYGVLAPANTPVEIVEQLNSAIRKMLGDPGVQQRLNELGLIPAPSKPQEFAQRISAELRDYKKILTDAGVKAQ